MSAPEPDRQQAERDDRSYVSIEEKWKGEHPATKVKLVDGCTEDEATRLRELAVRTFLDARNGVR